MSRPPKKQRLDEIQEYFSNITKVTIEKVSKIINTRSSILEDQDHVVHHSTGYQDFKFTPQQRIQSLKSHMGQDGICGITKQGLISTLKIYDKCGLNPLRHSVSYFLTFWGSRIQHNRVKWTDQEVKLYRVINNEWKQYVNLIERFYPQAYDIRGKLYSERTTFNTTTLLLTQLCDKNNPLWMRINDYMFLKGDICLPHLGITATCMNSLNVKKIVKQFLSKRKFDTTNSDEIDNLSKQILQNLNVIWQESMKQCKTLIYHALLSSVRQWDAMVKRLSQQMPTKKDVLDTSNYIFLDQYHFETWWIQTCKDIYIDLQQKLHTLDTDQQREIKQCIETGQVQLQDEDNEDNEDNEHKDNENKEANKNKKDKEDKESKNHNIPWNWEICPENMRYKQPTVYNDVRMTFNQKKPHQTSATTGLMTIIGEIQHHKQKLHEKLLNKDIDTLHENTLDGIANMYYELYMCYYLRKWQTCVVYIQHMFTSIGNKEMCIEMERQKTLVSPDRIENLNDKKWVKDRFEYLKQLCELRMDIFKYRLYTETLSMFQDINIANGSAQCRMDALYDKLHIWKDGEISIFEQKLAKPLLQNGFEFFKRVQPSVEKIYKQVQSQCVDGKYCTHQILLQSSHSILNTGGDNSQWFHARYEEKTGQLSLLENTDSMVDFIMNSIKEYDIRVQLEKEELYDTNQWKTIYDLIQTNMHKIGQANQLVQRLGINLPDFLKVCTTSALTPYDKKLTFPNFLKRIFKTILFLSWLVNLHVLLK
jgi:hypothetical protein